VCLVFMSHWHSENTADEARLGGDFYIEDEIYRSAVPINWWEAEPERGKPFDLPFPLCREKNVNDGDFEINMQNIQTMPKFSEGRNAPEAPTDSFFTFTETTVEVIGTTADDLGNRLISIFSTEHAMHIIKISQSKFAIKAESTSPAWFVWKVRLYSKASSHMVEFQRRGGDAVAFSQFFNKVTGLLTNMSNSEQEVGEFIPPHFIHDAASLQPFIDMVNNNKDPILLAEAASGLANAAVNQEYAHELCAPDSFIALKTMLRTGGYNILRPLAQLLSELATMTKAMPLFADKEFWGALLDVVTAEGNCDELKTQFASVALSALAVGASQEQKDMLKVATQAQGVSEQIRQMLEESAHMLDLTGLPAWRT